MDNTAYIFVFIVFLAIFIVVVRHYSTHEKRKVFKNNKYSYVAKSMPMTPTESEFFKKLNSAVQERYYVFPQIHLSSIFRSTSLGNESTYAFRHINGKSVDYILCDKQTLKVTYAIELDDFTHESKRRKDRDNEVERIFNQAQLPLVRFNDKNISEEQIIQALVKANSL